MTIGPYLAQVLAERRPLTWQQKLAIMEQVSDGLAYAHGRALVHRDLKPANLPPPPTCSASSYSCG